MLAHSILEKFDDTTMILAQMDGEKGGGSQSGWQYLSIMWEEGL